MNKVIEKIRKDTKIHYLIICIVTIIIALPIGKLQLVETDDGKGHISRVIATQKALVETNFPHPLTTSTVDNHLGYGINLFYGKLPVYGALILKLFSFSYTNALKLLAILSIFLSGITMYHYLGQVTKRKSIALLGAILYMTANYRLEEIYTRFALGEFVTFIFLPMILQGIDNIINSDGKKSWILGVGTIGLILSHSITTMYFAIFCIGYILLHGKKIWNKRILIQFGIQILFAILITAFYTIPILEHKFASDYAIFEPQIMYTNIDAIQEQLIGLKNFFLVQGAITNLDLRISIPIVIGIIASLFAFKRMSPKIKNIWIISMCLSIVALFMCTKYFPWSILPDIFYNIQFPWRLTGIALLFLSIASAIGIVFILENIQKDRVRTIMFGLVILLIAGNTFIYVSNYEFGPSGQDEIYEQKIINDKLDIDTYRNWDYLPTKAYKLYTLNRKDDVIVLEGKCKIDSQEKNGLNLEFEIGQSKKGSIIELPYLYYLGYEVTLQEENIEETLKITESENGFLQIELPRDIESGIVKVEYKGTMLERIGYVISIFGITLFILYEVKNKLKFT